MAFGDEKTLSFSYWFDQSCTFIFTFDLMINFFLAQEVSEGKYNQNFFHCALNYLKNSFLLDLFATIPLDQIIENINFNTSIIKGVRFMKIFKLVKILKLSKVFRLRNKKDLLGKELLDLIKNTSGFIDLMRQNMYILIGSHF